MVLSQKHDKPSPYPSESVHGCNLSQSCLFFCSPLKSSMISRSPTPVETYSKVMHLGNVFLCLVFYWMSFHKSILGSHSHNPHICCVLFYPGALAAMRVGQNNDQLSVIIVSWWSLDSVGSQRTSWGRALVRWKCRRSAKGQLEIWSKAMGIAKSLMDGQ